MGAQRGAPGNYNQFSHEATADLGKSFGTRRKINFSYSFNYTSIQASRFYTKFFKLL